MKKSLLITLSILILLLIPALVFSDTERVRGYWKDSNHDGIKDTYVQPHQRTTPNSYRTDNFSYPGNYNPNKFQMTPPSNSPRENYPLNPNPYERRPNRQKEF